MKKAAEGCRRMFLLELTFEYFLKVAIFAPKSISRPSNISKLHRQEIDIALSYQMVVVVRPHASMLALAPTNKPNRQSTGPLSDWFRLYEIF